MASSFMPRPIASLLDAIRSSVVGLMIKKKKKTGYQDRGVVFGFANSVEEWLFLDFFSFF